MADQRGHLPAQASSVRDPAEQGNADVDMDISKLHGWLGGFLQGGRDEMRG